MNTAISPPKAKPAQQGPAPLTAAQPDPKAPLGYLKIAPSHFDQKVRPNSTDWM